MFIHTSLLLRQTRETGGDLDQLEISKQTYYYYNSQMHFCIIFPLQSSLQTSAEIPKNLLSTEMQLPLGRSRNVASADLGVAREQAVKFGLVPLARAGWCGLCPGCAVWAPHTQPA